MRLLTKLLVFLGAFLLAVAALALFYAPNQVKRTPLDVNSVTRLSGTAELFDGKTLVQTPVKATSTTHSDSQLSTDDVVLFQNSSCLLKDPDGAAPDCVSADDPQNRLIAAGTDTFATDRHTGMPVNDFKSLPPDAGAKEGLINKFPFDVQKKTYPFWDGYVNKAVDAVFEGAEAVNGLNTYKFHVQVDNGEIEITDGVPGTYSSDKTMWIDPVTGSIINQTEHQVRVQSDNQQKVLDLTFGFTPDTVAANVKAAKDNGSKLGLLVSTVPMVGGILGLVSLVAGLLLWARVRRDDPTSAASGRQPATV